MLSTPPIRRRTEVGSSEQIDGATQQVRMWAARGLRRARGGAGVHGWHGRRGSLKARPLATEAIAAALVAIEAAAKAAAKATAKATAKAAIGLERGTLLRGARSSTTHQVAYTHQVAATHQIGLSHQVGLSHQIAASHQVATK